MEQVQPSSMASAPADRVTTPEFTHWCWLEQSEHIAARTASNPASVLPMEACIDKTNHPHLTFPSWTLHESERSSLYSFIVPQVLKNESQWRQMDGSVTVFPKIDAGCRSTDKQANDR